MLARNVSFVYCFVVGLLHFLILHGHVFLGIRSLHGQTPVTDQCHYSAVNSGRHVKVLHN